MTKRGVTKIFGIISLVAVSTMAASGWAGWKASIPVFVDVANRNASGSLGSARNSGDSVQFIGCGVNSSGVSSAGFCQARDGAGNNVFCSFSSQGMMDVVSAINSDSSISFSFNASGVCTQIHVNTFSHYEPKSP